MLENVPDKQAVVRALVGSGFTLSEGIYPFSNYEIFRAARVEQLGCKVRYMIAVTASRFSASEIAWLIKDAERSGVALVLVGEATEVPSEAVLLSYEQFFDRLGGPIFSMVPFDPQFTSRLEVLGDNKLPNDLDGIPNELFEQYTHAGLQHLFGTRVVRNGQERRGEAVADGIAIGPSIPLIIYDAKAASGGYSTSMGAVRQFMDYVNDFHKKYKKQVGKVDYFLVISGGFADDEDALEERSLAMKSRCGVTLCFLSATFLGTAVELLVREPLARPALDWHLIFGRVQARIKDVEKQLQACRRDAILSLKKG